MYDSLLLIHSLLRYALLAIMLLALLRSFTGWMGKKAYVPLDRKLSLFTVIGAHSQLVIGLIMYFMSPIVKAGLANMSLAMKDPILRFYTVEHISMMLIAIVLITMGSVMAKKAKDDVAKHKRTFLFFILALLIILASIPWPFMVANGGRGWI